MQSTTAAHYIARRFDENFPMDRANLIIPEVVNMVPLEVVLTFPVAHTERAFFRGLLTLRDNRTDEVEGGVLCGPKGRRATCTVLAR